MAAPPPGDWLAAHPILAELAAADEVTLDQLPAFTYKMAAKLRLGHVLAPREAVAAERAWLEFLAIRAASTGD